MQESSTTVATILQFRQEVERQLRDQIHQAVEVVLDEELAAALGSGRHERTEAWRSYRHGTSERRLTTADGLRGITIPRGRVVTPDGTTVEFLSALVPRYARRTRAVDDAILSCYLAGLTAGASARRYSRCWGRRCAKLSWKLKRLQTLWFDDVA